MTKPNRFLSVLAWAILVLAALFIVVISLDERCSRHEATWTDGGGRHATEMTSGKVSDDD